MEKEITEDELQKMSIEEIIHLQNFVSLHSKGGVENANQYESIQHPHWEITFKGKPTGRGTFLCFNREIPFENYRYFKLKTPTP